jgi:hypothetical protein
VVQEDILLPQYGKNVVRLAERGHDVRDERLVTQRADVLAGDGHEIGRVECR